MLGEKRAGRTPISSASVFGKLAYTFLEFARLCTEFNEVANARYCIKGHPIGELGIIPKPTVQPNNLKVTTQRRFSFGVLGDGNRLSNV